MSPMPRFVILQHEHPRGVHWDFMIESGPALRTWALPQPPESGVEMIADALPDHRLAFLDYEGPISGSRGDVVRWDRGACRIDREDEQHVEVDLAGTRLIGRAVLTQFADRLDHWRFSFRRGEAE